MDTQTNYEEEGIELTIEDVLAVATGINKDGIPNSNATIAIEEILENGKVKTCNNVTVETGAFTFAISGGCAVLQIDFPKQGMVEYRRLLSVCKTWMDNLNNKDFENKYISATVLPILLKGQIVMVFQNLVYYTGMVLGDYERAILCFDNNQSNVIETENIDYEDIKRSVEEEMKIEEEEMNRQLLEAKKELEEMQDENYYEENLNKLMNSNLEKDAEQGEKAETIKSKYGMRISK